MTRILTFLVILILASPAFGIEVTKGSLTKDSLVGKWNFTHMLLDGETNRPVNRMVEFLPDGEIVNFNKAGAEESRATYQISAGSILYTDKRGPQNWKVRNFDGEVLHVDHMGAEMFFKRSS